MVIKFADDTEVPELDAATIAASAGGGRMARFPGARLERVFGEHERGALDNLRRHTASTTGAPAPDLSSLVALSLAPGSDAAAAAAVVQDWNHVELAYAEAPPAPPPVSPDDDPRYPRQGHLKGAPGGIDVRAAWSFRGGDGRGVGFVDLEQGWTLSHEDVARAGVTLISGLNHAYAGHGTAVLGVVLGQDNRKGGIGIAPACSGRVVSEWRTASTFSTPAAILSAAVAMETGDVLLLEAQRSVSGVFMPVEVEFATYVAILVATALGVVVVEAAGNGGSDLDAHQDAWFGKIFDRSSATARDSGAIMVGAGSSAAPHTRMGFSNHGSRIDCFAWGQNVDTADGSGGTTNTYRSSFSGTSSASSIIAGIAVVTQGMAKQRFGKPFSPAELRAVLAGARHGTTSATPKSDRIGVMPDLNKVLMHAIQPRGDFPLPDKETMYAGGRGVVVIDPGHGGSTQRGRSTPYGSAGPHGAFEKDVNLDLGRRLARRLGHRVPVRLTRNHDHNVSLSERTQAARQQDASVFLSLHADERAGAERGSEVWIHDQADGGSVALGDALCSALGGRGERVPLRRGPMGVLGPHEHSPTTAAVLVDVDSLAHAYGEQRLLDGSELDAVAHALAEGVERFLSHAAVPRYGGSAAAVASAEMAQPQQCWHAGAEDVGSDEPRAQVLAGPPEELAALLKYLRADWATFAPREAAYFAALSDRLVHAGTLAKGTVLGRSTFVDAVKAFQKREGLKEDGVPGEGTLFALQKDWAAGRNLDVIKVDADKVSGSGGFDRFRLRSDIVERYKALRADVLAAGGVITSAGSFRGLGATVTEGRSETSMHYSGLAFDLATDTGMRKTDQQYLITKEGRRWRVWCRSDSAAEHTLDAVLWKSKATSTTSVTARVFDFTALAERHGFKRIGHRKSFPKNYLSAEWWHFQCEEAMTPYLSQFGIELLSLKQYTQAGLAKHKDVWQHRKRIFKRGRNGWH